MATNSPIGVEDRRRRLLDEAVHAALRIQTDDAEGARHVARHRNATDRDACAGCDVLLEHPPVVHLVNMITRQHQRVTAALRAARDPDSGRPHRRFLRTNRSERAAAPATLRGTHPSRAAGNSSRRSDARSARAPCIESEQRSDERRSSTQFDNVKSMLRKWPAKGIAGLHCHFVNSPSRVPFPPASTKCKRIARQLRMDHHRVFFVGAEERGSVPAGRRATEGRGRRCWAHSRGEASRAAAKPTST